MRYTMRCVAALCLFGLSAPLAFAQTAERPAASARFQYDDLHMWVAPGQPMPGPDDFERQYAAALDHFAHTRSLADLKADAAAKRVRPVAHPP